MKRPELTVRNGVVSAKRETPFDRRKANWRTRPEAAAGLPVLFDIPTPLPWHPNADKNRLQEAIRRLLRR